MFQWCTAQIVKWHLDLYFHNSESNSSRTTALAKNQGSYAVQAKHAHVWNSQLLSVPGILV